MYKFFYDGVLVFILILYNLIFFISLVCDIVIFFITSCYFQLCMMFTDFLHSLTYTHTLHLHNKMPNTHINKYITLDSLFRFISLQIGNICKVPAFCTYVGNIIKL